MLTLSHSAVVKTNPERDFFVRRTHEVAPRHNTDYSHAHIAQIKNAREHCVHTTDHFGWRFLTTHTMKCISITINVCTHVDFA